jgi:uncharacterized protein (DUF1499 family)
MNGALWALGGLAAVGALYFLALVGLSVVSRRAPALGLVDGRLRPCKSRRNCISTEDRERDHPEPPFAFRDDGEAALDRLARAIARMPRSRIVERRAGYLRAEFQTSFFRFVDDLEVAVDPAASVLQLRSASRVGNGDHGMNRARLRELRRLFAG